MPKTKATTQDHLDIEETIDDLVLLKNGWVALVMVTNAVNFDLLSEAEQDATIYAYGAFLNSLSFPMQVLIRSKKADITAYFQSLEEARISQPNPDLKRQIQKYQDFIQTTVQQKTVLDKKFYLIINFSPLETGLKIIRGAKGAGPAKNKQGFSSNKQSFSSNKARLVSDAKIALMPKRDHIIKQTARLGLTTRQLTNQELIELFYDIYNPAPAGTQKVLLDPGAYTTPIVEPAIEIPASPTPRSFSEVGPAPIDSEKSQEINPLPTTNYPLPTGLRPVPPLPSQSASTAQTSALNNLRQATAQVTQALNREPSGQSQNPNPREVRS